MRGANLGPYTLVLIITVVLVWYNYVCYYYDRFLFQKMVAINVTNKLVNSWHHGK